jgi:hypothetical protein
VQGVVVTEGDVEESLAALVADVLPDNLAFLSVRAGLTPDSTSSSGTLLGKEFFSKNID